MPKRKKKKKSNHYFTQDTEDAIVAYARTEDIGVRTKLYVEHIQPAFNELVDKIVYTYKYTSLQNINPLKEDCKIWLTTILDKYNPDRGTKAFSYFSVVTKNWFTHKAKKQAKQNKREIHYDSMIREVEAVTAQSHVSFEDDREDAEFWMFLLKEIDSWKDLNLKENERKVLNAVEILLTSIEEIDIFNKKAIYLYMREITGLNTKQIVSNLNRLRERFRTFKKKWNNGEVK
jgi:hypothetical protein|tara:strand:+ start:94 stop:789 length:696 start_codon:yes stop_codon:yes gene_type:complete